MQTCVFCSSAELIECVRSRGTPYRVGGGAWTGILSADCRIILHGLHTPSYSVVGGEERALGNTGDRLLIGGFAASSTSHEDRPPLSAKGGVHALGFTQDRLSGRDPEYRALEGGIVERER
jgi:hypothetical protein